MVVKTPKKLTKNVKTREMPDHTLLFSCVFFSICKYDQISSQEDPLITTEHIIRVLKQLMKDIKFQDTRRFFCLFFFFLNLPEKKKRPVHLRHSPLDTKPLMSVKRAIISKIKTFVYHGSHILNSVWEAGGKTDSDVNSELAKGLCVTDTPLLHFTWH